MRKTVEERFWEKVVVIPGGCWEWVGTINWAGYGRFEFNYKMVSAHRFAYQTIVGKIPEGLQIDHLCRNRACVNPFLPTRAPL